MQVNQDRGSDYPGRLSGAADSQRLLAPTIMPPETP